MNVAIIPARGGSKRIPRKNIKLFNGKPIIVYSINAALSSGLFDEVIVSTDDDEIAKVSESYGAKVPFRRPEKLADDFAGTGEVISHALHWLETHDYKVDYVCCIYATCPLLLPKYLNESYALLKVNAQQEFCFSVCDYAYPVHRSLQQSATRGVEMLFPQHLGTRSQDLPRVFHDAGQFYWGKPAAFLEKKSMFADHSEAFFMPRERVCDIDTEEDWRLAELMQQVLIQRDGV